ncbi:hypothetical protein [Desulfitobacterium chlororespirans]|uniref:Uncharacterized protein n=1 Tax=Desulfitobacterium chlororespirans DSM 11544 TaxID=1121395 RepID=A0A1M7UZ13_9FIRM|nr:hypothetical protein [Desulfitobacterium chlororespirans]SHN88194.1 hypothetical protein SAMN02745215_05199 [Desulfitobacterium chlororespirans DSM 11544]
MKRNIVPIIISILVLLQVVTLVRIGDLQNDLQNTQNQLVNMTAAQSSQINSIYANIDSMLKRQASIIDSYDYALGTFDRDNLTVPVTFNISPKETKADTLATVYVSGQSTEMTRSGTSFSATLPVNIFDTIDAKVVIADDGTERTEKLEVWEDLRARVLPAVQARFEGESGTIYRRSSAELSGEYSRKGNLSMEVTPVQNDTIEKARFVVDVDGRIVSEKALNSGGLGTEIDEKITLSAGQTLTLAALATDSFGLIHKVILDKFTLDEHAEPVRGDEWMWMGEVIIMDNEGKILYAPQYDKVN